MMRPSVRTPSTHRRPWLAPGLGGLLGGLILWRCYLPTMATGILSGDQAALQVLADKLGVPHGTGFTVYMWLAHFMTYLPFGESPWRVTLLSGLCTAAAGGLLYLAFIESRIGRDPERWIAAGVATTAFALAPMVWRHAVVAEVYGLHLLLVGLLLWLSVRWANTQSRALLFAGAFLLALSWGNHMMATAMGPPMLVYGLLNRPRQFLELRRTATVIGCFLAGLASVLLLFWLIWRRDVPSEHLQISIGSAIDRFNVEPAEWDSFWRQAWFVFSGEQFRNLMGTASADWKMEQWQSLPYRLSAQFSPLGLVLVVLGWLTLWRTQWRLNLLLSSVLLTQMVMIMNYQMEWEIHVYYLPVYLVAAFWVGAGMLALMLSARAGLQKLPIQPPWAASTLQLIVIAGLWFGAEASRERQRSWADSAASDDRAAAILRQERPVAAALEPEAARRIVERFGSGPGLFLGDWENLYAVHHLGERAGIDLRVYELQPRSPVEGLSPARFALIRSQLGKRKVLLERLPRSLWERFRVRRVSGRLFELTGTRQSRLRPSQPVPRSD